MPVFPQGARALARSEITVAVRQYRTRLRVRLMGARWPSRTVAAATGALYISQSLILCGQSTMHER